MVLPLIAAAVAADEIFNDGETAGDVGEAFKDFSNVGKNKFNATPYQSEQAYWGGDPNAAANYYNTGQAGLAGSQANQAWAQAQANQTGPMAWENQGLSNQEATSRGYHQEGALNLALQGALGNQPSEAAYMLQGGLDRAVAAQQAQMGGARGAAALANAQGNAGANIANLQQGAFTEAGRLRANEIAGYTGMYGNLAGQQRGQDQNRLNMGNQMAQFNAQNTTQRQLGFGQLGLGYGQLGSQYYGQMGHGYDQQLAASNSYQQRQSENWNQAQAINAGVSQSRADMERANRDMWLGMAGSGAKYGSSFIPNSGGGGHAGGGGGGK